VRLWTPSTPPAAVVDVRRWQAASRQGGTMPTTIEALSPSRLSDTSLTPRGPVHQSPADWRDQILYFLLPDRFSDGREATRPRFDRADAHRHAAPDKAAWMASGNVFQGGTIRGIASKLDYLQALGVTALWIGPIFKQRGDIPTYHGYAIQDFLDVDPRFGTRQQLRDLVDAAHARGIYVLLDIIYNHSGNNWFYERDGSPVDTVDYRFEPPHALFRWRSGSGQPIAAIPAGGRDDGVWPVEFQNPDFYTRAGSIGRFDPEPWENPLDPRNEFRRGDFFSLKDLAVQERVPLARDPGADAVLSALIRVYQYWIALTDVDGFRVDTVKHVSFEASRNFCGAIHEYAESIGKHNFLLLGEVAGGAGLTRSYLDVFGRNLDAALDLGEPMDVLAATVKGLSAPSRFFAQFGGHDELGTHREVGRYHVSVLDDHDMINRHPKARFAAGNADPARYVQSAHAIGMQLTTLGIPCIYYGSEQAFDGSEAYHDLSIEGAGSDGKIPFRDRYIREAMFGGAFGAFGTSGCDFFDRDHPTYLRIAAIARVVTRRDPTGMALRRGRQYPREVRFLADGGYQPPRQGEIVAWSRIMFDREVLVVLNTHGGEARGGDVTVDHRLHPPGSTMSVLYRSDWSDAQLRNPPTGETVAVGDDAGRSTVRVDLPAAGMAILA
jgi:glycosidase